MIVTLVEDPLTIARLVPPQPHRAEGLHYSDIASDLWRQLQPKRFGREDLPEEYIGVGLAFERVLARALRRVARLPGFRPEPVEIDGIWCSPDWLGEDFVLEEWKCTHLRMPRTAGEFGSDSKFARYHMQAKAYCHALDVQQIRFRVLFINGDYAPPQPCLKTYLVRYSPMEIDENWELLVQHAKDKGML